MKYLLYIITISILFSVLTYGQLIVKDQESTPNTLLEVNDEGTAGSVTLPPLSSIGIPTNKLYNIGTSLYWNGSALGTTGSAGGWTDAGTIVQLSTGSDKVGIGSTAPLSLLSVGGSGNTDAAISGLATSQSGRGVYGYASSNQFVTNYGGYFRADGRYGVGVYGEATNDGANNYGGYFEANGLDGTGVYGASDGTNGFGVYGYASNTRASTNYGGYFNAQGTLGRGIQAYAPPTGYAGYFLGRVHATGAITGASKNFRIDHPLDPTNKYLFHTSVESPDMMNIYNGNIVTNESGEANVELPIWFDALNKDFRYQLTVLGEFAQAIVSEEISNNQFSIKTNKPNIKVSWQVTGIRHDNWANKNRTPVEEMKTEKEKGKYLHPAAFNMPKTAGVDYDEKMEREIIGFEKESQMDDERK